MRQRFVIALKAKARMGYEGEDFNTRLLLLSLKVTAIIFAVSLFQTHNARLVCLIVLVRLGYNK